MKLEYRLSWTQNRIEVPATAYVHPWATIALKSHAYTFFKHEIKLLYLKIVII